ncbi:MAG: TlpA disulfide reductase family protein [Saprospiraceae bacterium]|jgi:thiol-disulfide isomerase/thioredoxin|nr:TlpA family protein disulfide reductase [Saprospiraceae bacterium]
MGRKAFGVTIVCLIFIFNNAISQVPVVDFSQFKEKYLNATDYIYVFNFWATWCKPCIEELPLINAYIEKNTDPNVKFVFVSLDDRDKLNSKVVPFVNKNKFNAEVIMLDDPNSNNWIDKIMVEWTGSIPATVLKYQTRKFLAEKKFYSEDEIKQFIDQVYH